MSWRGDLISRLRADAALAAALGTRIAWFEAGRSWTTFPRLVLQEISPGRDYTHSGPDGLDGPRVQFDIFAEDGEAVEAVETALIAEMEQAVVETGSTRFHHAFLEGRRMLDPVDLGNNRRVQRMTLDFTFFHETI
ncbi:MAG: hypothetical protein CL955_06815 [Erythrobacteraceae bacterium]|nr:hypothetical protein [Erythrobacteraceae bacterium]